MSRMREENVQTYDLKEPKVIGVFGSARTGSSYIFSSLNQSMYKNIIDLGELFNPWSDFKAHKEIRAQYPNPMNWTTNDDILSILREKTGTSDCESMLKKLRKSPPDAIRYFVEAFESTCGHLICGKGIFLIKIFDQHIHCDNIESTVGSLDGALFVKRNFFDSYVSFKIAQNTEEWAHADTSKNKIKIDYDDLMWTYATRTSWEYKTRKSCVDIGTPNKTIEYGSFHVDGKTELQKSTELYDLFCDLCGISKLERDYQKLEKRIRYGIDSGEILTKQNKNKNILDSIDEGHKEEFINFIKSLKYDVKVK